MMMSDKNRPKNITTILKENTEKNAEGLTFPCEYPVKAMGANTEKFRQEMLFIVQKHCPETTEHHLRTNVSKTGKYQSVTITVEVETRSHLEDIYVEIKSHKDVRWIL